MIAYGTAIADRRGYETIARPGIERVAEPDSVMLVREGCDSIQAPYNAMLDEAAAHEDLEALVLVHEDLELTDDTLPTRLRRLLDDPRVGLVGLLGSTDVRGLAWWEHGLDGFVWQPGGPGRSPFEEREVDAVDGMLLALAPWVVRTLRFDEAFAADFHGYDVDFCLQVRAAGGRVLAADVPYVHHRPGAPVSRRRAWVRTATRLSYKWDPQLWPPEWAGNRPKLP